MVASTFCHAGAKCGILDVTMAPLETSGRGCDLEDVVGTVVSMTTSPGHYHQGE